MLTHAPLTRYTAGERTVGASRVECCSRRVPIDPPL
jgi:hypothetical protein